MKKITEHFENRLNERFGFEISTLVQLLKKPIQIKPNSEELKYYPHLKSKFKQYPKSTLVIEESLNMCIVTIEGTLITCYTLN
ncbi:MAG: hypothetical protein NTX34_07405 [Cytophagales bacterium]|nr:hypothetical protein [Cytophagales bacterium]